MQQAPPFIIEVCRLVDIYNLHNITNSLIRYTREGISTVTLDSYTRKAANAATITTKLKFWAEAQITRISKTRYDILIFVQIIIYGSNPEGSLVL